MELARKRIPVKSKTSTVRLYPVGDIHLGAAACDIVDAKRTRDAIARDPDALWIGMGDYADAILPSDPRWSFRGLDWKNIGRDDKGLPDVGDLADAQIQMVDDFFAPIWDRCLGLLEGNHEQVMERHYFANLTKRLCKRHGVPFLSQTCLYRLEFEANKEVRSYDLFAEHGATGGGTDGNSINNLQQRLAQWDASVYLKGHVHKRAVSRKVEFGWGRRKIEARNRVLCLTGTYLKGYNQGEVTYGERKGYPPNEIGGVVILIQPFHGIIDALNVEALELAA